MRTATGSWTAILPAAAWLLSAGAAWGLEGRYQGTLTFTETTEEFQTMLHRLDVTGRKAMSPEVHGNVALSLRYFTRPGGRDLDVLRTRLFGEFRGPKWRLHGDFTPWQDRSAGQSSPREFGAQVGLDWTTPVGPLLRFNYDQRREDTVLGQSRSEDRRIAATQVLRFGSYGVSWRRVDTRPDDPLAARRSTEEWKGGLELVRNGREVTLRTGYDFLLSQFRSRERVRDFTSHRLNLDGRWRPHRKWTAAGFVQLRRGLTKDNAALADQDLSEQAFRGQLDYLPVRSLTLRLVRELRKDRFVTTADFFRLVAIYDREVVRYVRLQAGFERNLEYLSTQINTPANSVFALVNGRLRPGLTGRVELRTNESVVGARRWLRLVQVRTDPVPESYLEVTWRLDEIPRTGVSSQRDQDWNFVAGYRPTEEWSIVGGLTLRDGSGAIARKDRSANLRAVWNLTHRSNVSFEWSRRSTESALASSVERTLRPSVTFWLPSEFRFVGTAARITRTDSPDTRTLSLTLEKFTR